MRPSERSIAGRRLPGGNPKGIKVTDDQMSSLNITGDKFHPEWNYTIAPRVPT